MRELRRAAASIVFALAAIAASCAQQPAFAMIYTFDPPEPGLDEPGGWVNDGIYGAGIGDFTDYYAPDLPYHSSPYSLRLAASYIPPGDPLPPDLDGFDPVRATFEATVYHAHTVVPGQRYNILSFLNADHTPNGIRLVLTVHDGDPNGTQLFGVSVQKGSIPAGWNDHDFGIFDAVSSTVYIRLKATDPLHTPNVVGWWGIDDLEVEEVSEGDMAVMICAFAKRAALARAQNALNAEIAFVEQEANIGLDLPLVTGWRSYDPGVATPDVVEFEIWVRGSVTFPHERYDQSTWAPGRRTRVCSIVPMRAAINHANRGNADNSSATLKASQMQDRSDFYGAALVRCYRNDPTCGQGNLIAITPRELRVHNIAPSRLSDDVRRVARVEFDFDMSISEEATGETGTGTATLPAVTTLETP